MAQLPGPDLAVRGQVRSQDQAAAVGEREPPGLPLSFPLWRGGCLPSATAGPLSNARKSERGLRPTETAWHQSADQGTARTSSPPGRHSSHPRRGGEAVPGQPAPQSTALKCATPKPASPLPLVPALCLHCPDPDPGLLHPTPAGATPHSTARTVIGRQESAEPLPPCPPG